MNILNKKYQMTSRIRSLLYLALGSLLSSIFFVNCSQGGSSPDNSILNSPGGSPLFKVFVRVAGLKSGPNIDLSINQNISQTITSNGVHEVLKDLRSGDSYSLSIVNQPSGKTCAIENGSGVITNQDVNSVNANCVNQKKRMYLTATQQKVNFASGLANPVGRADELCMIDERRPIDMIQVKAMIADANGSRIACTSYECEVGGASEQIDWVFKPNITYYRLDETTVIGGTDSSGLLIFPLQNSVSNSGTLYYTGINSDWTPGDTCSNWSAFSNSLLQAGHDTSPLVPTQNQFLTALYGLLRCSEGQGMRFLCVEQ